MHHLIFYLHVASVRLFVPRRIHVNLLRDFLKLYINVPFDDCGYDDIPSPLSLSLFCFYSFC